MESLDQDFVRTTVRAALEEDGAWGDATVAFLRLADKLIDAEIVADMAGVVAGIDVAGECFAQVDQTIEFEAIVEDGAKIESGDVLCRLRGPSNAILAAERVALNFVQRLSGVATLSANFVEKTKRAGVTILDTRKTTPLLRDLEKYAVRCGGAQNHRRNLEAMVLIKENHIRSLGGNDALIEYLKSRSADDGGPDAALFVEVEVDSLTFLKHILGAPVNRVMFDNFTPEQVREGLRLVGDFKRNNPGATLEIEVSGGITLQNVGEYAVEGVDYISVGALTHSAPALTLSLEVF